MTNAEHARRILLILLTERRDDADDRGRSPFALSETREGTHRTRPDRGVGRPLDGEGRVLPA